MHATTDRLEFAPPPTPGRLRSLGLAVLAHAFLLAALTWGVHWKSDAISVSAEAELWSAVPHTAAPKLVEVPPEPVAPPEVVKPIAPRPKPAPAPQVQQPARPDPNIALEREKLRLLKKEKQQELDKQRLEKQRLEQLKRDQLKQEKLQLDKKRLQDKRDSDKKAADDKKKAALEAKHKEALQSQEDAKTLEAQRLKNMQRMAGLAGASGAPTARGTQLQSSGPSASYAGRIRARIKPNIVFADDIGGNPAAEVEVRTAPDGTIVSRKLTKPSGVKSWDEAVLRAIDKTEVLPRDVDGRVISPLTLVFTPKD